MGRYQITRTHDIDCGHRVVGHQGKCANLHGHRYTFALTCEADALDRLGMVIDFAVIKDRLCRWLEDNWDHRMLIWESDPLLPALVDLDPAVRALPVNPTAENLAALFCEQIAPSLLRDSDLTLTGCTVHETAKCSARYVR